MTGRIYLDHAATTPLLPAAAEAMKRGFDAWANPSSPHAEGRAARALLEDARTRIKAALGLAPTIDLATLPPAGPGLLCSQSRSGAAINTVL